MGMAGNSDASAGYVVAQQSGGQSGTYGQTASAAKIYTGQNNGTVVDNTTVLVSFFR